MSNVKILKLMSGEEVIGEVTTTDALHVVKMQLQSYINKQKKV